MPFQPNEGSFLEPNEENIRAVKDGTAMVDLSWLNERKVPSDINGHPITGCKEHYSCLDRLHEANWRADEHKVRSVKIVKQLSGTFNTQSSKQFNAEIAKNNYFLNMMSPSTQIFVFWLLVELRNTKKNNDIMQQMKKEFPQEKLEFDKYGRLIYGELQSQDSVETSETESASEFDCQGSKLFGDSDLQSDISSCLPEIPDIVLDSYEDMDDISDSAMKNSETIDEKRPDEAKLQSHIPEQTEYQMK